ncbi:NfeD family protein [Nocardioides jiangxiensis]|uniref:NfeD family protein n=1 Tax=Nocardioides jiangxiensis TaxID=3064524 RepID=A0ABT9B447_9ACTN|nr:NfeD family protein [Nocardioides sp. WY-20]MDO7869614.1 NfeD family protein [Nocardioides sp. WY-20]
MEWIRDHAWEAWVGLAFVLAALELASLDFVLLMLAAGALTGAVAAAVGAGWVLQVVLAGVAAVAALGLVRPALLHRLHRSPATALGIERYVGMRAVVTARIGGHEPGAVRLDGETWTATADGGLAIEPGRSVDVIEIRGATAVVRPTAEGE